MFRRVVFVLVSMAAAIAMPIVLAPQAYAVQEADIPAAPPAMDALHWTDAFGLASGLDAAEPDTATSQGFARGGAGRGGSSRGASGRRPGGSRPNGRSGGAGGGADGSGSGSGSGSSREARQAEHEKKVQARSLERSAAEAERVRATLGKHGAAKALRAFGAYEKRARKVGGKALVESRQTRASILRVAGRELDAAKDRLDGPGGASSALVIELRALARELRTTDTALHERATELHELALEKKRQAD